jgi:DNA polymerase-3 subunit alpha
MGSVELTDVRLEAGEDARPEDKLRWEKELLGVYVSGHPLEKYREELSKRPTIKSVLADGREGIPAVIAGIIDDKKEIMTKNGDHMAFLRIADMTGSIEVVIFPKILKERKELVEAQRCVAVKGRLSLRNGQPSIVAEAIKAL